MTSFPFRLLVLAPLVACLLGCGGGGGGGGGAAPVIPPPTSQGVTVSGRVVDAASEEGVPNAEVTISPVSKSPALSRDDVRRGVTNPEGYYAVEDVQPGKATLTIQLPDGSYQALEMLIDVPGDRPTASVYIKLVPRNVPPPTTVTLSPKNPSVQSGSTLQFTAQVTPASAITPFFSVQGDIGTINGDGLFTAIKPGTGMVQAHVGNVSDGTTVTVTAPPATTGTIAGLVIDGKSLPVAGVAVATTGRQTTTSADGSFTISELAPGSYSLTATKTGFTTATKNVTVVAGGVATVDWVLQTTPVGVSVAPSTATVRIGETQTFSATVTGNSNTAVTWSVQEGAAGGSVSPGGIYTPPSAEGTYHVVAASQADPSKTDIATVTVPAVAVTVAPPSVNVLRAQTQTFSATVTGTPNAAVTWSVQEGASGGTVSAAGVYTAPGVAGTYHVVATSQADSSKKGTATVTVPPVAVSVAPTNATLTLNQVQTFAATVTGSTDTAVTWSVQEGAAGGTVTATGVYTAPNTPGTFHVTATSQADANRAGVATVEVQAGSGTVTVQ